MRVGNNSSAQGNIRQGQVIINNQGIQGSGIINQSNNQQQSSSLYQVQTLSGSAASISTGMLWSLTQNYNATIYSPYNQSSRQIIIQQQVLLPTTQGIQVIPRLLANGQVEVHLAQVNEVRVKPNSPYNQGSYDNRAIQYQSLNTRITVPRGQWVTIGQISQNLQNQRSNMNGNSAINSNNSIPIQLLVQ